MIFTLIIILLLLLIYKLYNGMLSVSNRNICNSKESFTKITYDDIKKMDINWQNENKKIKDFRSKMYQNVLRNCIKKGHKPLISIKVNIGFFSSKLIKKINPKWLKCTYDNYNNQLSNYEIKNNREYNKFKNWIKTKNTYLRNNKNELEVYKYIIDKYEKKNNLKKNGKPGDKCVFNWFDSNAIYNSKTCSGDSICLPIGNSEKTLFQEGICSSGEDGTTSPGPSNGKKHYYPAYAKGCKHNFFKKNKVGDYWIGYDEKTDSVCAPDYICEDNTCILKPSKLPSPYIPKNKSINRLQFQQPIIIDQNVECPINHTLIYDKYSEYCKNDKDSSKLCRLDLEGNKDIPLCDTFPCPKGYTNKNGICEDKDGDICSLEFNENQTYPLCGDLNMFVPLYSKDIRGNSLGKHKGVNADECQQKCLDNKNCDGFSMLQNVSEPICDLKKIEYDESGIKENNNKILYVRTPLSYKIDMDRKIDNEEIKTDESKYINTPYRCADECDKINKCVAFTYDKNKLKCKMYSDISKKKTDNNSILFEKYIIGGNLCDSIHQSNIQKEINKEMENMQDEYEYDFMKYKLDTKPDKTQIKKNKIIEYNNKFINKVPNKLFVWENLKIKCNKIIIKNETDYEMIIKKIIISSYKDGKIIDIMNKVTNKIEYSTYLDIIINFDTEYEIFKIFILFDQFDTIPITLNIYNINNEEIWCKTDYNLSIISTNLNNKINNINNKLQEKKEIKCNNYSIDYGFYYKKNLYLFRKIFIDRKKILLLTILDSATFKLKSGYPKLADADFPGINKYVENLKSILYIGDGNVLFIANDKYLKYHIRSKTLYDGHPKKMKDGWYNLSIDYKSNITNSVYKDRNICLLFNENKYKIYYLNMIENDLNKQDITEYSINNLIPNVKDIIYDCIVYNFDENEYILFANNSVYKHIANKIVKLNIGYQITDKLWKLNY